MPEVGSAWIPMGRGVGLGNPAKRGILLREHGSALETPLSQDGDRLDSGVRPVGSDQGMEGLSGTWKHGAFSCFPEARCSPTRHRSQDEGDFAQDRLIGQRDSWTPEEGASDQGHGISRGGKDHSKNTELPIMDDGIQLAKMCLEYAQNKKAQDPVILDLRGVGGPSDFFLVVSGDSEPHLKAIAGEIEKGVKESLQRRPFRVSGNSVSQWIILDYGDVLVHVMNTGRRNFYRLEDLWGDAPRVKS